MLGDSGFKKIISFIVLSQLSTASGSPLEIPITEKNPVVAIVALSGEKDHVEGIVTMTQMAPDQTVLINGIITGLPPGKHGFHISQSGDVTDGCYVSGSHFNPLKASRHGAPTDKNRHVGDLGNIVADDEGISKVNFTDSVISLFPSPAFIIGRVLVIHETFDDMGRGENTNSKLNGNAGGRLACGIIAYK